MESLDILKGPGTAIYGRRAESELERHSEDTCPGYLERRNLLPATVLGSASELLQFHERAEFHRDRSDLYWQRRDPAANAVSSLGDIQNKVLESRIAMSKSGRMRAYRNQCRARRFCRNQ
jgi:hypothetical protein